MTHPPLLLLTNDDGINAPGLLALHNAVQAIGQPLIVAPDRERSATSHTVTVFQDMPYRAISRNGTLWGHALEAMPADCVKLAVCVLAERKPALVLSGINPGANVGNNTLYSGTVGAAREGAMFGIPSLAVSLHCNRHADPVLHFETAAAWAVRIARLVLERGLPPRAILNINVPNLPLDQVSDAVISRQGRLLFRDEMQPVQGNGSGIVSYRNIGVSVVVEDGAGHDSDDAVLEAGKVSITPMHYDLTLHDFRDELAEWIKPDAPR